MDEKLRIALKISRNPEDIHKSVEIVKGICLGTCENELKLKAVILFSKIVPEEVQDILTRWRDSLPYLSGSHLKTHKKLLRDVAFSREIDPHERITTAVSLYNGCHIDVCYDCFVSIAEDENVNFIYRAEAAKYLLSIPECKKMARSCFLEIMKSPESSEKKYDLIVDLSRSGIKTMFNFDKIRVSQDEKLVLSLQRTFFNDESNSQKERILSGQYLLQTVTDEKEKDEIEEKFFQMAKKAELGNKIGADAADVISRLGKRKQEARELIWQLGFSSLKVRGKLVERSKTIYSNTENVHCFGDRIEEIVRELPLSSFDFEEIEKEVVEYISYLESPQEKFKAKKALHRIKIDTATFAKSVLSEIFARIWNHTSSYDLPEAERMRKKIVEELVDMSDTCSTGHVGRLVSIVADIKISWEDQIKANMVGRMNARIRDCPDKDLKEKLVMAESELSTEEEEAVYKKFIMDNIPELKEELRTEFVEGGHIEQEDFNRYFEMGTLNWI